MGGRGLREITGAGRLEAAIGVREGWWGGDGGFVCVLSVDGGDCRCVTEKWAGIMKAWDSESEIVQRKSGLYFFHDTFSFPPDACSPGSHCAAPRPSRAARARQWKRGERRFYDNENAMLSFFFFQ